MIGEESAGFRLDNRKHGECVAMRAFARNWSRWPPVFDTSSGTRRCLTLSVGGFRGYSVS
jgi:hypothetical protein